MAAVVLFSVIRVLTLTGERISFHAIGRTRRSGLETMGIGFGGAAIVLWLVALTAGPVHFVWSAFPVGGLYAIGFALYTIAFARGPVSLVSPWSNATVVMLWFFHPNLQLMSVLGLAAFALGAVLVTSRTITRGVVYMLVSDALLASSRIFDVHHVVEPADAYGASLFTVISLWMFAVIVIRRKLPSLIDTIRVQPGWSFVAASSNAAAYMSLFLLLRWLHPAAVEAISAFASTIAVVVGVFVFREQQGTRKMIASAFMTIGTILLLTASVHV